MGVISRFADIMEANINALLDKCEDPAKMIDQTLRKLNEELAEVKSETASIMAEEKQAKRRVDDLTAEVEKYDASARKAIQAGNDDDARTLLSRKQAIQNELNTAMGVYSVAKANSDKMQQMYNKLTSDINILNSRRTTVKAQVSMAKAQDRVTQITTDVNRSGAMDSFARMESKAQKMLDEATSRAELSGVGLPTDEASELQAKYAAGTDKSVDDELAALKAEMGIQA